MINNITSEVISGLLEYLELRNRLKPIIILIDDVGEKDVQPFLSALKFYVEEKQNQITVIISERYDRYTQLLKKREDIEFLFDESIWTLKYKINVKKDDIFNKVYPLLTVQETNQETLIQAKNVFLDERLESISESIFQLIIHLKSEIAVNYNFDWDEWKKYIDDNHYSKISSLFNLVACFYQFGVSLPLSFLPEFYNDNEIDILTIEAISNYGENCPIIFEQQDDGKTALALRNDYLTNWYLAFPVHQKKVIQFFDRFLSNLSCTVSIELFIKLCKKIRTYDLSSKLPNIKLNSYSSLDLLKSLAGKNLSDDHYEQVMMEVGLFYLHFNDYPKAVEAFEGIVKRKYNKYAHHQLAEIYSRNIETLSLAKTHYEAVYNKEKQNPHTIAGLYLLASRCKRDNIDLGLTDNKSLVPFFDTSKFVKHLTAHSLNELIIALVRDQEYAIADELLRVFPKRTQKTAICHSRLAKFLPFREDTIGLKRYHFQQAVRENYFDYTSYIEYAIFLFRLGEFSSSTNVIKTCSKRFLGQKELIEAIYNQKIISTEKLFFANVIGGMNSKTFEGALQNYFKQSKTLMKPKKNKANRILKAFLLLRTISYHSKGKIPDLYIKTQAKLATCHLQNATLIGWSNLQPFEHLEIAEAIYDHLFRMTQVNREINENLCRTLRRIIDRCSHQLKKEKLMKLKYTCNRILAVRSNRRFYFYYQQRAFAHEGLIDFYRQLVDTKTAFDKVISQDEIAENIKSICINNLIIAICNCLNNKVSTKIHQSILGIQDAIQLYSDLVSNYPNFKYTDQRRKDILNVDPKAFDN